ncbi:hypothetical protein LP316_15805 [Thalassotalea sp. LPB0316]|uniref:cytochrome c oxidase assembly factor Coa1 family protein n=1 Tax=Thalassotalea sp. LPB0316 TaxID=2769490 RepID=UPI0018692DB9|nr:cytochrome c oxidase assembly factor Coa1 family protein [Thalassotalea sp. LPB0316]QOL25727.1 hypothetical protein LP316_15805 [Thalassotalea sp. LPB0316]
MEKEYLSGMGKASVVPEEIKGWNWGAFLLNWLWGIGNSTYIALLMFVPFVNFIMLFVLGAKGNEWAWRNRTWRDVEHFKSTQKKWRNAGLIIVFITVFIIFIPLMDMMKGKAYQMSLDAVTSNPQVIALVGNNPEPGYFVLGEISTSGASGSANLNYTIKGAEAQAQVYVYATKFGEQWTLKEVLVVNHDTGQKVVVLTQSK